MKRILTGMIALLLLLGCALATEAEDGSDAAEPNGKLEAYAMVNIANDFLRRTGAMEENLFVGYQDLEEVGYGFVSAGGEVSMLCIYNEDQSHAITTMLLTSDPEFVDKTLYSACAMPFLWGDLDGGALLAEKLDACANDILNAMDTGEFYSATLDEAENFSMELMVTPLEEGNRLNLMLYWNEPDAGKAQSDDSHDRMN